MKDWKQAVVTSTTTLLQAIRLIDEAAIQIALVTDGHERLIGTLTDGDIRRALLRGIGLDSPVSVVMNQEPTVARLNDSREVILQLMRDRNLRQVPVVDDDGILAGVEVLNELIRPQRQDNWVVLMAGGLGSRLYPLTSECPKPLLKIGNRPILETILQSFIDHGFHQFFISVNYKANMVEDYFRDGSDWGVTIDYIREDRKLGTAGPLTLLPSVPKDSLLVMNGDLLTKVNFQQLLHFHKEQQATATMGVREYDLKVPYGVVRIDNHRLVGIDEKPVQRLFVNAGIYVLEPEAVELIPRNTYYDMPELFRKLVELDSPLMPFPIREYWLDIGHLDDFERANGEYSAVFQR